MRDTRTQASLGGFGGILADKGFCQVRDGASPDWEAVNPSHNSHSFHQPHASHAQPRAREPLHVGQTVLKTTSFLFMTSSRRLTWLTPTN